MSRHVHFANLAADGVDLAERSPFDYYPTNEEHIREALNLIETTPANILDIGHGAGAWGIQARDRWQHAHITGVDIRADAHPPAQVYNRVITGDFIELSAKIGQYELIIANPPYSIAQDIVNAAYFNMKKGGYMVMLLRLAFLASRSRYPDFWQRPPLLVSVCVDRPSFTPDGKGFPDDFAFYVWRRGYTGATSLTWSVSYPRNKERFETMQQSLFI